MGRGEWRQEETLLGMMSISKQCADNILLSFTLEICMVM